MNDPKLIYADLVTKFSNIEIRETLILYQVYANFKIKEQIYGKKWLAISKLRKDLQKTP